MNGLIPNYCPHCGKKIVGTACYNCDREYGLH